MRVWQTDAYSLQVLFSPDGKVMGKRLYRFKDTNARCNDLLRYLK
jgi:hypothetical protein